MSGVEMATYTSSVQLPLHIIEAAPGLALDFGSSLLKIAYRCKSYFHNGKLIDSQNAERAACVRLAYFPVEEEVETVLTYIAEHADIRRGTPHEQVSIWVSGNGGPLYKHSLETRLNVRLNVMLETEAAGDAFRLLSKYKSEQEFLYDIPERAVEEGSQVKAGFKRWRAGITCNKTVGMRPGVELPVVVHDIPGGAASTAAESTVYDISNISPHPTPKSVSYPCILAIAGSAFFYILVVRNDEVLAYMVSERYRLDLTTSHQHSTIARLTAELTALNADGTYAMVDHIHPGGFTFMGLINQLTGVQDYQEVAALAATHTGRSLDVYSSENPQPAPGEEYPLYTWHTIDYNIFPYGKARNIQQGEASKGELVASLYNMTCHNLSHMARLNARIFKARQIYFLGHFVENEVARFNIIRDQLCHVTDVVNPTNGVEEEYLFPRDSGMYTVIGTFLQRV